MSGHLLICDGNSILRRYYEAIKGLRDDSPRLAEEAANMALSKLYSSMRMHQATHAFLAFDPRGGCWRQEIYPGYKASRSPAPECFLAQIELYRDELHRQGFSTARVEGFEADDVINTLALKALDRGFSVTVESTDKDLTALVAHGAVVYDPFKKVNRDAAWIAEKFDGVRPEQVTDYLALCGDQVDGIPGVPGIGHKTAARLLKEHTDLDRILSRADSIVGAVGMRVRAGREQALLSRRLVAMRDDVPMRITPAEILVPASIRQSLSEQGSRPYRQSVPRQSLSC